MRKSILFHRDYRRLTGGHLKVLDYYRHASSSPGYEARIFLTAQSSTDHPWKADPGLTCSYTPETVDILFLAGRDWNALDAWPGIEERKPVINLIQHVRHASPADQRFRFLHRRAIRICVSEEVAQAIRATGLCNGPIHVVPNALDWSTLPAALPKDKDVFIAGLKRPRVARALYAALQQEGFDVDCQTEAIDRPRFLDRMGRAKVAVVLPMETEGFFLPALEAMALGCAVICPDCIGNRSFCIAGDTCLMPKADPQDLSDAVRRVFAQPELLMHLRAQGEAMAKRHDIQTERNAFLGLLDRIHAYDV